MVGRPSLTLAKEVSEEVATVHVPTATVTAKTRPKVSPTLARITSKVMGSPSYGISGNGLYMLSLRGEWFDSDHVEYWTELLRRKYKPRKFQITRPHYVNKYLHRSVDGNATYVYDNRRVGNDPVDDVGFPSEKIIKQDCITLHPLRREVHRLLVVIDRSTKMCTLLDSNVQNQSYRDTLVKEIKHDVLPHFLPLNTETADWNIAFKDVPQQIDSYSCGIHMLQSIESILKYKSVNCTVPDVSGVVHQKRFEILETMLESTASGKALLESSGGDIAKLSNLLSEQCTDSYIQGLASRR